MLNLLLSRKTHRILITIEKLEAGKGIPLQLPRLRFRQNPHDATLFHLLQHRLDLTNKLQVVYLLFPVQSLNYVFNIRKMKLKHEGRNRLCQTILLLPHAQTYACGRIISLENILQKTCVILGQLELLQTVFPLFNRFN